MIHDPLDDLLDRSAPVTRAAAQVELDAMIADAGRPTRRALRPRILVAAALATVLACSGVGLAAATDGFAWAPWAEKPIGAVQFTMANGFQCELRFSEYTAGDDPAFVTEVNDVLEEWYRSADVLGAVQILVPMKLADLGAIELKPGETLDTLPPGEAQHRSGFASGRPGTLRSVTRSGGSWRATASSRVTRALQGASVTDRSSVSTRTTSHTFPALGRETSSGAHYDGAE